MSKTITPDKFEERWEYKYVRFVDNKVLFCDACSTMTSHQDIVLSRPEVKPFSAGKIVVKNKTWYSSGYGSVTAKLKSDNDDEKYIEETLTPYGIIYSRDY